MASSVFITALEARQNPIRERVVFDEATGISSAILEAVRTGYYEVVVSGGTPMTANTAVTATVYDVDDDTDTFDVGVHPFNTGDEVYVFSTGELPSPLVSGTIYYVIYVDRLSIRLAATKQDALAHRPVSIDLVQGISSITLTNEGSGYTSNPSVTVSGGDPSRPGQAFAVLAPYGNVSYIVVGNQGAGYHYPPTVQITAQGSGAVATEVIYKVISVDVNAAGTDYRLGDLLTVGSGSGTPASARVTGVNLSGGVLSASVVDPGSYEVLPTLINASTSVSPGGGNGCTLDLTMGIRNIVVASGGQQYTAPPLINIIGGGGSGAFAEAVLTAGVVSSITVTDSGSGYTSDPTVSITSGRLAQAVAYLVPTGIANIQLLNDGGNTYTDAPAVTISAAGSGASVDIVYMRIISASLATGGAGSQYVVGDELIVAGGAGAASATIRINEVDLQGSIVNFTLLTSGLYSTLPVMTNNAVYGGNGQAASFNLTAGIDSANLSSGGSGFTAPPTVVITPNDQTGYGASAYSVLSSSTVSEIVFTAPGTGYTATPTISVTSGEGAAAQAVLNATGVQYVNVSNVGSGYTSATVSFVSEVGSGAAATATVLGGQVTGIVVTSQGSGYTSAPAVVIQGDGIGATAAAQLYATSIDYLTITNTGQYYTSVPNVSISGAATGNVSLYGTGIEQIIVTNGGEDYTSDPQVYVIPGAGEYDTPVSPTLSVIRGFSLSQILITDAGLSYQSAPTITISAPSNLNGNTATATATIGYGTGTMSIESYPPSRDYWTVWQNGVPSDPLLSRPYADRMDTVINYFTNLGYKIIRRTNPSTNNTFAWRVTW
jgi:hypothetical protein